MCGEGGVPQEFQKALYYFNRSYGSYPFEKLLARSKDSTEEIPKNTRFAIYGGRYEKVTLLWRLEYLGHDIAQGVLLEVQELDRNYDAQTAHGRSEGLWSVTD